jgi:hypothetical protein
LSLRDPGYNPYRIDINCFAFGALDGERSVEIRVSDTALDDLAGKRCYGSEYAGVLSRNRRAIFEVAQSKYRDHGAPSGHVLVLTGDLANRAKQAARLDIPD